MLNFSTGALKFYVKDGKQFVDMKGFGCEVSYGINPCEFHPRAEGVLMDLDGTTLDSENFWIYIIEKTVAVLTGNDKFSFETADIPYVSGYTTVEHLMYCIRKYCRDKNIDDAMRIYHTVSEYELNEIMENRGNQNAFSPNPGLKNFLETIKKNHIKIGLATSGLDYKAIPEIVAVFRRLNMGSPFDYYDAIITGGRRKDSRDYGTIGEIAAKPHPYLYTELAYMGLKIKNPGKIIGIEDSAAGILSLRTGGFPAIGLKSGNIDGSGLAELCSYRAAALEECLEIIL